MRNQEIEEKKKIMEALGFCDVQRHTFLNKIIKKDTPNKSFVILLFFLLNKCI